MYWERDQEITLLHLVLEPLHPEQHAGIADEIICGLIEMELVCCERAPVAQQAWQDEWEGREVTRQFIERWYVTDPEYDEIEDE